jgi:hypothetical protein
MKFLLSTAILSLTIFPLGGAIAQNRECPSHGYYGAMSNVCPPPSRTSETWEASELKKREETASKTRLVCRYIEGGRNDETDVAQRCRVERVEE